MCAVENSVDEDGKRIEVLLKSEAFQFLVCKHPLLERETVTDEEWAHSFDEFLGNEDNWCGIAWNCKNKGIVVGDEFREMPNGEAGLLSDIFIILEHGFKLGLAYASQKRENGNEAVR